MIRKEKLSQAKKLADLWYQQQKIIYIAQQKERRRIA